jgi:hypothetical protein
MHRQYDGPCRTIEARKVTIQCTYAARHPGIASGDAEFIMWPPIAEADEFDAGIAIVSDQISVRRTIRCSREDTDAAIVVLSDTKDFLLEHGIDAVIRAMIGRLAGIRIGEREARTIKPSSVNTQK